MKLLMFAPLVPLILGLTLCHKPAPAPTPAQAAATAAPTIQGNLNAGAAAAATAAQAKSLHIFVTAQDATHAIQSAPGAETPVPPDVLAAWSAGIDRVRAASADGQPAQGPAQGGDGGAAHAAEAVPASR